MQKTEELFELWTKEKQDIEKYSKIKRVKVWEIWLAKIWVNIWSEISKDWNFLRPVLVIKSYLWWDLVWVIPITTKYNENYSNFLFKVDEYKSYWLKKESYFSLNNFKIISLKRLEFKINWYFRENVKYRLVSNKFIQNILLKKIYKILE